MEYDEIVVKESPGLCRCCLSEGCYKDLGTEYAWMNETEVYADMLLECFDISITQHNEGPNGPNRLICEVCITRLRDACNFKKQVLESEKRFIDLVGRGEFRPKVLIYQTQMKAEDNIEEVPVEDVEYLDDEIDFGDDEPAKHDETPNVTDDVTVDALPVKGKRGRPRKSTDVKTPKKMKIVDEKPKTSKAVAKEAIVEDMKIKRDWEHAVKKQRKGLKTVCKIEREKVGSVKRERGVSGREKLQVLRESGAQLLMKSTLMPFRWLKSCFRCFYCYEVFKEPRDLKSHQFVHQDTDVITKTMSKYWDPLVYVDVSNVSCKICNDKVDDLDKLIDHLNTNHQVQFSKDIGSLIKPFKLHDITVNCVLCDKQYTNFAFLLIHTNKEHAGISPILCDICGQHLKTERLLRDHVSQEHEKKPVECSICGETVASMTRMRTHLQRAHNKRYKCFFCSETFENHYKRTRHMILIHKKKEEHKCPHCSLSFVYRNRLLTHIREKHLKEKNVMCNVCGWEGFGKTSLDLHMRKHSDERNYPCPSCEKAFKTRKNMRQHHINIHQKGAKARTVLPNSSFVLQ